MRCFCSNFQCYSSTLSLWWVFNFKTSCSVTFLFILGGIFRKALSRSRSAAFQVMEFYWNRTLNKMITFDEYFQRSLDIQTKSMQIAWKPSPTNQSHIKFIVSKLLFVSIMRHLDHIRHFDGKARRIHWLFAQRQEVNFMLDINVLRWLNMFIDGNSRRLIAIAFISSINSLVVGNVSWNSSFYQ